MLNYGILLCRINLLQSHVRLIMSNYGILWLNILQSHKARIQKRERSQAPSYQMAHLLKRFLYQLASLTHVWGGLPPATYFLFCVSHLAFNSSSEMVHFPFLFFSTLIVMIGLLISIFALHHIRYDHLNSYFIYFGSIMLSFLFCSETLSDFHLVVQNWIPFSIFFVCFFLFVLNNAVLRWRQIYQILSGPPTSLMDQALVLCLATSGQAHCAAIFLSYLGCWATSQLRSS